MDVIAAFKSMKTAFRPSISNIPWLILCLGALGIFLFLLVIPRGLENERLSSRVSERQDMIQTQHVLHPVQRDIQAILDEPLPAKLHQGMLTGEANMELEEAAPRIRAMADEAALNVRFIRPDASALARDGVLLVDCSLSGEMFRLWEFLLALAGHPWLLDVQDLEISSGRTGEEFRLRLLIAMDKG